MNKPSDDIVAKFFRRVQKDESGCWLWVGKVRDDGYGSFPLEGHKECVAHRWSYAFHKGVDLERQDMVRHTCSNLHCVNPDHLQLVKPFASLTERFLTHVKILENGCWLWTAHVTKNGYGLFQVRVNGLRQKGDRAHRWSYELFKGPIPEGMHLDHLCRNRTCVNPEHLEPVTPYENQVRGERARGSTPLVWRALYRDLYRQVHGNDVTEDEWIEDAKQRQKRLDL